MSDDRPSITKIRALIAERGECAGPMTTFPGDGIAHVTTVCRDSWVEYIEWLAAMVEHAPVLLDIVEATLAYRKAKKTAAKTRNILYQSAFPDSMSAESEAQDKEEIRCRDAYDAALAKVQE